MKRNNIGTRLAFLSLGILLVLELTLQYDSWSRQIALSLTNIIGGLVYLWIFLALKRRGIVLPGIVSLLVAAGIWSDALANFWHLFGTILWWDKLAHALGSVAPAAVFWSILHQLNGQGKIVLPRWAIGVMAIGLTMTLASVYEISEMIGDLWFPTHRITDLFDTADDLMYNLAGSGLTVVLAERMIKGSQKHIHS